MSEAVIIVEVMDESYVNDLYKFSSYKEVDKFCTTLKKGTKVKIYVPNKIVIMEVK